MWLKVFKFSFEQEEEEIPLLVVDIVVSYAAIHILILYSLAFTSV